MKRNVKPAYLYFGNYVIVAARPPAKIRKVRSLKWRGMK